MEFRIELSGVWRADAKRRYMDGIYRVPTDMSVTLAEEAIRAGVAIRLEDRPTPPQGPDLTGRTVVLAAPGPSLTEAVVAQVQAAGVFVMAVGDAYRMMPFADALYHSDGPWWDHHKGVPYFAGAKWSAHGTEDHNNKLPHAERYGLNLIGGRSAIGFSGDPRVINYGQNSGFQATQLLIHWGAARIVLVGFDMRAVDGKTHFFGKRAVPSPYKSFIAAFRKAATQMPRPVEIINATPKSALACFPRMELADALA